MSPGTPSGGRSGSTNPCGRMPFEAADNQIHVVGESVPRAADEDQRPVGDQRLPDDA